MPIAIAEHHEMLRQSARRWLESYCPREVPRAVVLRRMSAVGGIVARQVTESRRSEVRHGRARAKARPGGLERRGV